MITFTINGKTVTAAEGSTILEAARANGITIPTLCFHEDMKPKAACGLCTVTADGTDRLACATRVKDGMVVITESAELFAKRKACVQEMFRQHRVDCHHCLRIGSTKAKDFDPDFCRDCYFCDCVRDGFCELQAKALEFGVDELPFEIHEHDFEPDLSTGSIIRDPNKCIRCRRCTDVCRAQGVGILGTVKTDKGSVVGAKNSLMADGCVRCGRCVGVCPTGALFLREHKDEAIYFAHQYGTKTAALLCSDVLDELERLFKAPEGSFSYEQVAAGLKKLGIDRVYDPRFARRSADKQAAELLEERLGKGCLLLTNDYAAKNLLRQKFPGLCGHFAFTDSVQQIFGDRFRREEPDAKLYSITNRASACAEAAETGCVDYCISARELCRIFLRTGVDPAKRVGEAPEQLAASDPCEKYAELLRAGRWSLNASEPEEMSLCADGKEYKALICTNLGQVKKAVERMQEVDIIKIIG